MGQRTYALKYFYGHQYMTNLRDPSSQAGSLYDIYADGEILNEQLTFLIPVYNNMPDATIPVPTSLTANQQSLYYINSMKIGGINFRKSPNGDSLGSVYKNTVVELLDNQGYWSKVRIIRATSYVPGEKRWNSESLEGYVATSYLKSVTEDIPDYRNQVDMGDGGTNPTPTPNPDIGSSDFKIDGDSLVMTPATNVKSIKEKYAGAVVKKADGTDISGTEDSIGTGMTITIDGKTYTVVKYGDVNGDGAITPSDYVKIKNKIMGASSLNGAYERAADVNKDGTISPADYVKVKNHIMQVSSITL